MDSRFRGNDKEKRKKKKEKTTNYEKRENDFFEKEKKWIPAFAGMTKKNLGSHGAATNMATLQTAAV